MTPPTTTPAPNLLVSEPLSASHSRRRMAWIVALAADAIQWLLLPLFTGGLISPLDDVLDLVVGVVLWRLLGWHWTFLPTFVAELLPGVDLVPCWTIAVWLATRGAPAPAAPAHPPLPDRPRES